MNATLRYTSPENGLRRLRVLLPHLIAHEESHRREFAQFRELLVAAGASEQLALFDTAVQQMNLVDLALRALLEGLGGPGAPGGT